MPDARTPGGAESRKANLTNRAPCMDTTRDGASVHDMSETVNPDIREVEVQ